MARRGRLIHKGVGRQALLESGKKESDDDDSDGTDDDSEDSKGKYMCQIAKMIKKWVE